MQKWVGARSADGKRSERGALMQKRVGARSGGKSWSAERRCQKGPERGAEFTPGPPPLNL